MMCDFARVPLLLCSWIMHVYTNQQDGVVDNGPDEVNNRSYSATIYSTISLLTVDYQATRRKLGRYCAHIYTVELRRAAMWSRSRSTSDPTEQKKNPTFWDCMKLVKTIRVELSCKSDHTSRCDSTKQFILVALWPVLLLSDWRVSR
jgi:hypothetical protein